MLRIINPVVVTPSSPQEIACTDMPLRVNMMPMPGNTRLYERFMPWWVEAHIHDVNIKEDFELGTIVKTSKGEVEILSVGFDEAASQEKAQAIAKNLKFFSAGEKFTWVSEWFDDHPNGKALLNALNELEIVKEISESELV